MAYLNGSGPRAAGDTMSGLIQLVFTKDTMLTISDNFKDWENIKRVKVAGHDPRAILYSLTKSLGSQAVQGRKRGKDSLPTAKGAKYVEAEARLKRLYSAIEIDYDLLEGAKVTPDKYADPLAQEIKLKSIAQNRYLSGVVNRDGSSVLATIIDDTISGEAVGSDSIGDDIINFDSNPSVGGYGAGHLEYDEAYAVFRADGSGTLATVNTKVGNDGVPFVYVLVVDTERNDNDNYAVVQFYSDAECTQSVTSATAALLAGDVLCKAEMPVPKEYAHDAGVWKRPNGSAGSVSLNQDLSEYGLEIGGLYAIAASDGATYNGVEARGSTKVTETRANSKLADLDHLQRVMDKLNTKMGRYKYNQMLVSPGVQRTFLQAQESDRRLRDHKDKDRGFDGFGFKHGGMLLACEDSQFVPKQQISIIPADAKGVVQMHGSDFKEFNVGGMSSFPVVGSDGYETAVVKYMYATMTFICNNPAAIGRVTNVGILETE